MKVARCRLDTAAGLEPLTRVQDLGASWIRLGDVVLICSPKPQWDSVRRHADAMSVAVEEIAHGVTMDNLYVVRQKGRLFQQLYPWVPVMLDRGRFLIVRLTAAERSKVVVPREPTFVLDPVQPNAVVFDERVAPARRRTPDPLVQQLVDGISKESFDEVISHIVSYPTRLSTSENYLNAAHWCQEQLANMGYQTRTQNIDVDRKPSCNIVAERAGRSSDPGEVVLVGAHLDSVNHHGQSPEAKAPGADDNGSGSAALLEMARVMSRWPAKHDLRLILFAGEEQGLYGSAQYVASLSSEERRRIKAVVNMDMIGGLNVATQSVTIESKERFSDLIDALVDAGHTYTSLTVETSMNPFGSDHMPFIEAAIPAALPIEGADTANHFIHSDGDTLAHVNDALATAILKMNTAYVAKELGISS